MSNAIFIYFSQSSERLVDREKPIPINYKLTAALRAHSDYAANLP